MHSAIVSLQHEGTAKVTKRGGVKAMTVNKIEQESPNLMDLILGHKIDLVIDTPPQGADHAQRWICNPS